MLGFAKKFIGSSNDRKVKGFMAQVQKINALEDKFAALSDGELRMMTDAFRDRLAKGESLDKLLNEAFAVVPMVAMRDLDIPHARLNVHGGACALGHPIGASGARILVTLLAALQQRGYKRGVAAVCIGGGEATAVAIELY